MSRQKYIHTRAAMERMHFIANLLRHDLQFTAKEVADRFEVSRKTIVRDLTFMRDRLGWNYEWRAGRYHMLSAPNPQL